MSLDETINVYFVTVKNSSSSNTVWTKEDELQTALTYMRNHLPEEHIRQIKASEGFPLIASGKLTKKDVFVLNCFEGDFFQQLQQTKSLIIGPRCLIICLLKCEPIPLGTSPVYTVAMRNLHISATGIAPQEKERLRRLIEWMGGYYFADFGRGITHLISNTIKSTKYEQATLNGIPVMHVDWVQRVWDRSCVEDVSATDEEFNKYRLPIFFGTNITSTGLETEKKNEIARLINENGGTYQRSFRSQLIDIVISEKSGTNSEKYKAAVTYHKDVLLPEWVLDSVQKGFALPTKAYRVKALNASTPTKTDQSVADFTSADQTNFSDISHISVAGPSRRRLQVSSVNETACSSGEKEKEKHMNTFVAPVVPTSSAKALQRELLKKSNAGAHYRLVLEELSLKAARSAGNFLDGCCIYLSGFSNDEREKLNRILNVGGATRYDVVNEKITHIIVGEVNDLEFKNWKKDGILTITHIVRLEWLLESIKLKQTASEVVYRVSLPTIHEPDAPSPSSKKTLRSMNQSFKKPDLPIKKKLFDQSESTITPLASSTEVAAPEAHDDEEQHAQNLLAQYSQENFEPAAVPMLPVTKTTTTVAQAAATVPVPGPVPSCESLASTVFSIDYENMDFLEGTSVFIDSNHFPEELYLQLVRECEAAKGNVVNSKYKDTVDYAIVCFEGTFDESKLPVKARHIVTDLYMEACLKQNELVPIEYYHKSVPHTANSHPLQDMTIVVSTYTGIERDFIDSLAQLMGARVNKVFVKKERPLLVCPLAEGCKYEGALKWGYPIVNSTWLVKCAEKGKKLPFQPYLVGDSVSDFAVSPALRERTNVSNVAAENQPAVTADFTPLRNKRVSELAGPNRNSRGSPSHIENVGASSPSSPHTPSHNNVANPAYKFDFIEGILAEIENEEERACLREVITEMRNNQTPELERIRRQACTPINRKLPTPKGIPDFCTTPEFEKRMADEFERRWRLPTKRIKPDTPIDEIRRRVLRATCKALGISYSDDDEQQPQTSAAAAAAASVAAAAAKSRPSENNTFNTPVQHSKGGMGSVGKVGRTIFAQQLRTPEAPSPVSMAAAKLNDMDTFVPSTQSPGERDNNSSSSSSRNISGHNSGRVSVAIGPQSLSTINFDKISFEETKVDDATKKDSSYSTTSPDVKKITEYLQSCESRRQSLKRSARNTTEEQAHLQHDLEPMETDVHYVQPFESEQFGGTEQMVGWRDPAEFSVDRRSKIGVAVMQHTGSVPRFSISCSSDEVRHDVIEKIEKLGGLVSENLTSYDATCTHFLCEKPNRGEKMLGYISSGVWVLSLRYIEESYAKDTFVDEELFEWGNCKALNMPPLSHDEQIIAQAAHRWRKELSETPGKGAFTGIRAILRISERNSDALKKVIKAGKGEIIDVNAPYNKANGAHRATHCFVDVKKAPLTQADYNFLQLHGVQIFTQMYINAYLMKAEMDLSKYEIQM